MASDEKNLTFSTRQTFFNKKKNKLNLKKYIHTSNGVNKYYSNRDNILNNNTIYNIKNEIPDYYYKNPFFYNNNNLDLQMKVLRELKNVKINRNSTPTPGNTNINTKYNSSKSLSNTFVNKRLNISSINNKINYKHNIINLDLPNISLNKEKDNNDDIKIIINDNDENQINRHNYTSFNNYKNSEKINKNYTSFIRTPKNNKDNEDYFYKIVFKTKPIFRRVQKLVIDNKFNMIYAENEEQYKKIIEKEYIRLISEGKKVKSKNIAPSIKIKLNETKKKIKFMKGIVDYTYPGFVLSKIKYMQKRLNEHKNNAIYLNYINEKDKRNKDKKDRNQLRKEYLLKSITLFK